MELSANSSLRVVTCSQRTAFTHMSSSQVFLNIRIRTASHLITCDCKDEFNVFVIEFQNFGKIVLEHRKSTVFAKGELNFLHFFALSALHCVLEADCTVSFKRTTHALHCT